MKLKKITLYYYLAIILLVISSIFHILTYIPSLKSSKFPLVFILGIAIFPTFITAIKSTKKYTIKSKPTEIWKKALKGTPKVIKKFLWVVISYVFFNFFFSLLILNKGLNPEIIDGNYVLEYQGRVVEEITEDQYYKHQAYAFRGVSGHFILFQFISMAMLSSAINLRKKEEEQ